jgi:hypothetical protein
MELPLLARGELPQRSRKVGGNDGMADGGDHGVASMEGSGRGRMNFRRGAWRNSGERHRRRGRHCGRTVHHECGRLQ